MTCLSCDRSGPGDRSTGYDADGICPSCEEEGWRLTPSGRLLGPGDELEDVQPRMARASLKTTRGRTLMEQRTAS